MRLNNKFRVFECVVGLLVLAVCCLPVGDTIFLFSIVPAGLGRTVVVVLLAIICLKLITGRPKDYYRFFLQVGYKLFGLKPAKSNRAYRRR